MLVSEMLSENRIRYYSDEGYYIRQVETGVLYEDAAHDLPVLFTYEETDELIPEPEPEIEGGVEDDEFYWQRHYTDF